MSTKTKQAAKSKSTQPRQTHHYIATILALALVFSLLSVAPPTASAADSVTWTQQPQSQIVALGDYVTFTVKGIASWIAGPDPNDNISYRDWGYPYVVWEAYMPGDSKWREIWPGGHRALGGTLTLKVTADLDGAQFRAVVHKEWDELFPSNAATLTVRAPAPVVTKQPENVSFAWDGKGRSVSFSVEATGTGTLSYRWYENENPLSNGGIYSGATSKTLTLSNVTTAQNGNKYRCLVIDSGGPYVRSSAYSNYARLSVQLIEITVTPPEIINHPVNRMVATGETATFTVEAYSTLYMNYQWEYNNGSQWLPVPTSPDISGQISPTLKIENAKTESDNTRYRCRVSAGSYSPIYSNEATLRVVDFYGSLMTTVVPMLSLGSMSNFAWKRPYMPGMFSDVDENEWYGANGLAFIMNAYEYGLVDGYTDGTFWPDDSIQLSQVIVLAAKVRDIYYGGDGVFSTVISPWYKNYVDYAVENGIITSSTFSNYDAPATRAQMAYIFSRCLPEGEFPAINTVNSLPDVSASTTYRNEIFMLYRAGILTGNDDSGTFAPNTYITRAMVAGIVSHVIIPSTRVSGRTW